MSDCDEERATRDTDDWQAADCKNPMARWVEMHQYGIIIRYVEGCSSEDQKECLIGANECPLMQREK
jgi:hypothetical protein